MSRFGYLRTPMPEDGSAEAQADAFVSLMDALDGPAASLMGGSAGALFTLQTPIWHPERVSALILLVPLGYRLHGQPSYADPMAPWVEASLMRVIGANFLFRSAMYIARDLIVATVLATPYDLLESQSAAEQVRINAILDHILPVSARLFLAITVALSVVFARLSVNTGFRVLPAIMLHGAINWASMVLPVMPQADGERTYGIVVGMLTLLALAMIVKPGPVP